MRRGDGATRGGAPWWGKKTRWGAAGEPAHPRRAGGGGAGGRPATVGLYEARSVGRCQGKSRSVGRLPKGKGRLSRSGGSTGRAERSRQGPMNAWAESGRATPPGTPVDSVSFTAETPGSTPRGREWHRGGETIRGTIGQPRADSWRLGDLLGFAAGRGWGTVEGCLDSRTCPSCWRT